MAQFFSDEYFTELAARLQKDPDWIKGAAKLTAKLMMTVTDRNEAHLLDVQSGNVTVRPAKPDEPADFKFEGPYEVWVRIGKERKDLNSLVLQGKIKFRGSLAKLLPLQGVLVRVEAVARAIPAEF
jgi:putative sterol carrier protein